MALAVAPRPAFAVASPSRRRFGILPRIAIALVVWSTLAAAPTDAVTRTIISRPSPFQPVAFHGRGYGHGVGMSQYGARGRALAGQSAATILAHYYPGTTIGARSASTVVRVLLLSAFSASPAKPATITGRGGAWTIAGVAATFPADARLLLAPTATGSTTWSLKVVSAAGAALLSTTVTSALVVRPASSSSLLELTSKPSTAKLYRGELHVRLTSTVTVVNHVALDLYLRGVVPAEMPASWPSEALKAQAIAARSYTLYRLHPSTGSYDVYDDTRSQVYRGRTVETTATNAAVTATAGKTLLAGTAPANALFHSADGGWTENNENVFVSASGGIVAGAVSYLRGASDRAPDGTSYDAASPYATWHTATYTDVALSAILARDPRTNVGTILQLDLSHRGVSGRLISVTLTGTLATRIVSGNVFVAVFNANRPSTDPPLRDTLFSTAPIS